VRPAMSALHLKTDAELNELFAARFAGWELRPPARGDKASGVLRRYAKPPVKSPGAQQYTPSVSIWKKGTLGGDVWPDYCKTADAVLLYVPVGAAFRYASCEIEYWPDPFGQATCYIAKGRFARALVAAMLESTQ
jgi:hypothetical protein